MLCPCETLSSSNSPVAMSRHFSWRFQSAGRCFQLTWNISDLVHWDSPKIARGGNEHIEGLRNEMVKAAQGMTRSSTFTFKFFTQNSSNFWFPMISLIYQTWSRCWVISMSFVSRTWCSCLYFRWRSPITHGFQMFVRWLKPPTSLCLLYQNGSCLSHRWSWTASQSEGVPQP